MNGELRLTDSGGFERNATEIDERYVPLKFELCDSNEEQASCCENADDRLV